MPLKVAAFGLAALTVLVATAGSDGSDRTGARSANPIRPGHGSRSGAGSIVGRIGADLDRSRRPRHAEEGEYPEKPEVETYAPRKTKLVLTKPSGPATAAEAPRAKSGFARPAADDFTIFRQTVVTTNASQSSEPTIANDRNGIIATGNTYAFTSGNAGLTFPSDLQPFTDPLYGGFCCDQVAYAVDRGGYSTVFWLRQYRYCGVGDSSRTCTGGGQANEDALRLRVYRGRDDLLDGSDYCDWTFTPQESFDLDQKLWFDFNHISNTSKYLYLTTNVRDAAQGKESTTSSDDPRVGALIWRMSLDDIDDGNCQVSFRYWYRDGDIYIDPVQNAGSTMYMATTRSPGLEGRKLRIFSVADGSAGLVVKDKDVKNWEYTGYKCAVPGGDNGICKDMHAGRMSGWRSGGYVGWMWTAAQDNEFPFPQIRVAVFETGSLNRVEQHEIWNDDFAWMYAYAGVNARGDLGVILYQVGGGHDPNAQAFLRTDPTNWDGITMHSVASSNAGASDWGHYAQVVEYGDCSDTFLGMAWVMDGANPSNHMVWFGDEDDGCPDLAVTAVSAGIGAPFGPGETMHAFATVQSQGSDTAPTSKLAYYLSRDEHLDDGDDRLHHVTLDPIAAGKAVADTSELETPTFFGTRAGTYYLIACADDTELFDEISDSNNCRTSGSFEIETPHATPSFDQVFTQISVQTGTSTTTAGGTPTVKPGTALTLKDTVGLEGKPRSLGAPAVVYVLSRAAGPDDDEIPLASAAAGAPQPGRAQGRRTLVTTRRLVLPRRIPPGPWYLLGCLRHPRNDDARASNDCRSIPLTVQSGAAVTGPRRPSGRQ